METQGTQVSEMEQNGTLVKREQEQKEQDRTIAAKKRFLEFYEKTLCNVELAAKASEIGRTTVYNWRKADPDFVMQMDFIKTDLPDFFENKLKEMALKGDGAMVRFWLSRRHPEYKMKIQHEAVVLNLYGQLTEEQQLERLRGILAARGVRAGKGKSNLLNGGDSAIPENGGNPSEGGAKTAGSGESKEGDIPVAPGPLENNGDNDQLHIAEVDPKPESEGVDNEREAG